MLELFKKNDRRGWRCRAASRRRWLRTLHQQDEAERQQDEAERRQLAKVEADLRRMMRLERAERRAQVDECWDIYEEFLAPGPTSRWRDYD